MCRLNLFWILVTDEGLATFKVVVNQNISQKRNFIGFPQKVTCSLASFEMNFRNLREED